MSALANLKLVASKRSRQEPPVQQRRNRLVAKIWEQRMLAEALQEGKSFERKVFRSVRNAETGERASIETSKRVKPWWWTAENGKICLNIKYGTKAVELAKGKTAIEIATMPELISTLDALKAAVLAGELDSQIEALSGTLRQGFLKK